MLIVVIKIFTDTMGKSIVTINVARLSGSSILAL